MTKKADIAQSTLEHHKESPETMKAYFSDKSFTKEKGLG